MNLQTLGLQALAFAIAAVGCRPLFLHGRMLSLSLMLYFAAGAFATAYTFNSLGTLPAVLLLPLALAAAIAAASLACLPALAASARGLATVPYGIFTLSYASGAWLWFTYSDRLLGSVEGVALAAKPSPALVAALGGLVFVALAIVVRRLEVGDFCSVLRWMGAGVDDLQIYGIDIRAFRIRAEILCAATCAGGGWLYALALGTAQSGWGTPAHLVPLLLTCLLSLPRNPFSTLGSALAVASIAPLASLFFSYRSYSLAPALLGLGLYLYVVYSTRRRRTMAETRDAF